MEYLPLGFRNNIPVHNYFDWTDLLHSNVYRNLSKKRQIHKHELDKAVRLRNAIVEEFEEKKLKWNENAPFISAFENVSDNLGTSQVEEQSLVRLFSLPKMPTIPSNNQINLSNNPGPYYRKKFIQPLGIHDLELIIERTKHSIGHFECINLAEIMKQPHMPNKAFIASAPPPEMTFTNPSNTDHIFRVDIHRVLRWADNLAQYDEKIENVDYKPRLYENFRYKFSEFPWIGYYFRPVNEGYIYKYTTPSGAPKLGLQPFANIRMPSHGRNNMNYTRGQIHNSSNFNEVERASDTDSGDDGYSTSGFSTYLSHHDIWIEWNRTTISSEFIYYQLYPNKGVHRSISARLRILENNNEITQVENPVLKWDSLSGLKPVNIKTTDWINSNFICSTLGAFDLIGELVIAPRRAKFYRRLSTHFESVGLNVNSAFRETSPALIPESKPLYNNGRYEETLIESLWKQKYKVMDVLVYPRSDDETVTITNRLLESEHGTYRQDHDNIVEIILIVETRAKHDTQLVVNLDRSVDGISLLLEPKKRNWRMYTYKFTNDHFHEDGPDPKRLEYLEVSTQTKYRGVSHFYIWPPIAGTQYPDENSTKFKTHRKKASRLFNRFLDNYNLIQTNFNPSCFIHISHQLNDRQIIASDIFPMDTDFNPYSHVTRPYQYI